MALHGHLRTGMVLHGNAMGVAWISMTYGFTAHYLMEYHAKHHGLTMVVVHGIDMERPLGILW